MKIKTTLFALCVSLLPAAGFAACMGHQETAQSCADGYSWDAAKGACIETITG